MSVGLSTCLSSCTGRFGHTNQLILDACVPGGKRVGEDTVQSLLDTLRRKEGLLCSSALFETYKKQLSLPAANRPLEQHNEEEVCILIE